MQKQALWLLHCTPEVQSGPSGLGSTECGWERLPLPGPQSAALLLQPQFLQDVFSTREPQNLMTLVPLTLLGTSVQEFGQHIMQQPTAQIQLLGNQGFIPTILGALSGLAPPQEASYASHFKPHLHLHPPKNMSWLGTAMVGEPCTLARMLKSKGRRFGSARNKVEGSEYRGVPGGGSPGILVSPGVGGRLQSRLPRKPEAKRGN